MLNSTLHRDRIMSAVAALQDRAGSPTFGVYASWQRCIETYGLDPADKPKPPVLSQGEVRSRIAVLDRSEEIFRHGVSELSSLLNNSTYEVSLCDCDGVTLFNLPSNRETGSRNVERPGTTWIEPAVGTNGIGTCLWEARPVSVIGAEHFLSVYAGNDCAAAPIKDCDGTILAVMNITAPTGSVSRESHSLASEVLNRMADTISRRLFRLSNETCFLLELMVGRKGPGLIAVREEGTIVSADLRAQAFLSLGPGPSVDVETIRGTTIWDYFDRYEGLFGSGTSPHSIPLTRVTTGMKVAARSFLPQRRSALGQRGGSPSPVPPADHNSWTIEEACGLDPAMAQNARLLERLKDSTVPILLVGETGVGKSVLARAIHYCSARATKPYILVSCTGLSEAMLSRDLFGDDVALNCRPDGEEARLFQADGGTLVLDGIGDLPPGLQSKLLRFLETAEATASDGKARRIDLRLISTSSLGLADAVKNGSFRRDLYYRVAGATIDMPALRRRCDTANLARQIIRSHACGRSIDITDAAMSVLVSRSWPGNLRELSNVLLRAMCMMDGTTIQDGDICDDELSNPEIALASPFETAKTEASSETLLQKADRSIIRSTMLQVKGDVVAAMRGLGVSRATLYRKLKMYDLMHLTRRGQSGAQTTRRIH